MSATVCEMIELYLPQWQFSVQCVTDKTKLTQKISTFHNISDKFMIFSHFISLQMSYDFRRLTHPFVVHDNYASSGIISWLWFFENKSIFILF
jgi:hypothetical protein